MTETLLDALGWAGDKLAMPGDYLRGALGGKFGERMGSKELFGIEDSGLGGDLLGFAGDVATDPLTFAGGLLGGLLGKSASRAAALRGPRYGTTIDDVLKMPGATNPATNELADAGDTVLDQIFRMQGTPGAARALDEIHPGSSVLGAGAEGVVFKTPGGGTTRIGYSDLGAPGRPAVPEVNQATRGIDYPTSDYTAVRVEHAPFAERVGDNAFWRNRNPETMYSRMDDLGGSLGDRRLDFWDRKTDNVGLVGGRPVVIDPGAVEAGAGFAGGFQPVMRSAEGSPLMRALLAAVGGDRATRRAVEAGMAGPNFVPSFAGIGAGTGASAGAYGRQWGGG